MPSARLLLLLLLAVLLVLAGCVRRPCASGMGLPGTPPYLDAHFSMASCCGGPRYVWTGNACTEVPPSTLCGCDCTGRDCDKVFLSLESCERAYRHCG